MAQVKKPAIRDAILESAFTLFSERGYNASTLNLIASGAGVSAGNIYVYFKSKLDILYAIYDPWLRNRLAQLEVQLAAVSDPRDRLRLIFATLWLDIPAASNGFANNLMQAVSTSTPEEGYTPTLLRWSLTKVAELIRGCLPVERRDRLNVAALAQLAFMAFDGYVINQRIGYPVGAADEAIDLVCDLLLGPAPGERPPTPPSPAA